MPLQFPVPFSAPRGLFSAPPASPDTVIVASDYTLAFGDSLSIDGSPGIKVVVRGGADIQVQLDGDVSVTSEGARAIGLVTTRSMKGMAQIDITGGFQVHAMAEGAQAVGLQLRGQADRLDNQGAVDVFSHQGDAVGVAVSGASAYFNNFGAMNVQARDEAIGIASQPGAQTVNYGTLTVQSDNQAVGFLGVTPAPSNSFVNLGLVRATALAGPGTAHDAVPIAAGVAMFGGSFANAGEIHAVAHGVAIGVELLQMSVAGNSIGGVIEAHANGPDAQAVAVLLGSPYGPSPAFTNQGLIRADVAISSFYPGSQGQAIPGDYEVDNYGKIIGAIQFGDGADIVENGGIAGVGVIKGQIDLGGGDDLFDSRHGVFLGDLYGGAGNDTLTGSKQGDLLTGDDAAGLAGGDDVLIGLRGGDILIGGQGDDTLNGGRGADQLRGGEGADVFVYNRVLDSHTGEVDQIQDLDSADTIDLHRIDAEGGTLADDAFHIVSAFTGAAGELVVSYDAGSGITTISGDVDGDAAADLTIQAFGDHSGFTNFVL